MELKINHRPGAQQFEEAMAYFKTVIADTVEEHQPANMACTHFMVTEPDADDLPMHIWHKDKAPRLSTPSHVQLVYAALGAAEELASCTTRQGIRQALGHMPLTIFTTLPTSFFIEVLHTTPEPFSPQERTRMLFGVVDNQLMFVSTEGVRLVRLDDALYGLAVQAQGSYLLDVRDTNAHKQHEQQQRTPHTH